MLRVTATVVVVYVCFAAGNAVADSEPVPLDVAVRTGLVEVEVKGRGAASGDSVQVEVRRKAPREARVVVEPGMVLEPVGTVQSMVCLGVKYERTGDKYRRVDVMVLADDRPRTFVIEAYCRDFQKPTPRPTSAFQLGGTDVPAARIIVKGKAINAPTRTIQIAIWLQKGVSEEQLRHSTTGSQLATARVLVEAGTPSVQEAAAAAEQAESATRILVKGLLDELMRRRQELGYLRGDTVEVIADEAPIRAGRRIVGTAYKGAAYQVLAVARRGVHVEFVPQEDDGPRRGWISREHVQLAEGELRGEGRPVLRRIGEIVSETELEVVTAAERGL